MKDNIEINSHQLKIKGKATIDIFDERGKQVNRIEKNNYVHPKTLEYIAKMSAFNQFGVNWSGKSSSNNNMDAMYLTDNSNPAEPTKDFHIAGNLIGVASRVYTSPYDNIRGIYNSQESTLSTHYNKFVYDFPTNVANGTFQSIYTLNRNRTGHAKHGQVAGGEVYSGFTLNFTHPYRSTSNYYYVKIFDKKMYCWYQQQLWVHDLDKPTIRANSNSTYVEEWTDKKEYALPYSIVTLTASKTHLYFSTGTNVYRTPIDSPTDFTLIGKMVPPDNHSIYGSVLMYNENTDKLYTITRDGSYYLSEFDLNINLLSSKSLNVIDDRFDRNSDFIRGGQDSTLSFSWGYLVDFNTLESIQNIDTPSASHSLGDNYLVNYSGSSSGYVTARFFARPTFFSRVVLDSPVTKTSQNTMKITYEFTMDDFVL